MPRLYGFEDLRLSRVREPERQVVREAVSRRLADQPRSAVVAWMNAEGHRGTMGGEWTNWSLGRYFANPAIAGLERDESGNLVESGRPALITPAEFRQLEIAEGHEEGAARPVKDDDFPYLLSESLAECGLCQSHLTGGRSNASTPSYRCRDCGRVRTTAAALEDFVGEHAVAELSRRGTQAVLLAAQQEMRAKAEELRQEIENLTASRDALADPYAEGHVTRSVLAAADGSITDKLKDARRRLRFLEQIADAKLPLDGVTDLIRWWEHAPVSSKRAVVALLFESVQVHPARARGARSVDDRVVLKWRTAGAA
ncbi:zinc ribbon domain-containing protein [Streptomyces sp. NPDC091278]|uniref:zinc ribbon domain-containing protein n=1 Tax=Streptomyces sp. NPDC091278 TaxID=3155301 RepID=UPI00344C8F87